MDSTVPTKTIIWIVVAILWVPVAFMFSGYLNGISRGVVENQTVSTCDSRADTNPLSAILPYKECLADVETYGVPFPFRRVYSIKTDSEPTINQPLYPAMKTQITHYFGVFGELKGYQNDFRSPKYGSSLNTRRLLNNNFLLLLIGPTLLAIIYLKLFKKDTEI